MAWLFLLVAGLCEIAWAVGLKYTEGFSRLLPTFGTVAAMAASIGFLFCLLVRLPRGNDHLVPWMNACISSNVSLPSLLVSIALKIRS